MAAITSAASGSPLSASTWVDGVIPGPGDTVTVANGHLVGLGPGESWAVGTSGATGTEAMRIVGTGRFLDEGNFSLRGDLLLAQTATTRTAGFYPLEIKPGGVFEFDASGASTPLSQTYVVGPTQSNSPNARVLISGTSGSRATVRSNASGGNGRFSLRGFNTRLGSIVASYGDFLRIGDATNPAISLYLSSSTGPDEINLDHCTFDACGRIESAANTSGGAVYSFADCRWTGSLVDPIYLPGTGTISGAGVRRFLRCTFDRQVFNSLHMSAFTVEDCAFASGVSTAYSTGAAPMASFRRNFIRRTSNLEANLNAAAVLDCYLLHDHSSTNSKLTNPATQYDTTFDGIVCEHTGGNDTTGDMVSITGAPSALRTISFFRCVAIPNRSAGTAPDDRPSTLFTITATSANWSIVAEHNTWIAGVEAATVIGESGKPAAGVIASLRDNLFYGKKSPAGLYQYAQHDYESGGIPTADVAAAANVGHNGTFGLRADGKKGVYNATYTGTPGAGDVSSDPQFVDYGRRLSDWDASLGGPGTTAGALARIYADPTLGDVARQWVAAGYAPTNPAYKGSAHDGADIGAVPVVLLGLPPYLHEWEF